MSDVNVAQRYAEALMEVAVEAGEVERIAADLHRVEAAMLLEDGLLRGVLASPVFTSEERERVLNDVLPKLGVHGLTGNLLKVMNANKRFSIVAELRRQFDLLADKRAGRVRVKVSTAEPLSPQLENEIKAALEASTGKSVIVEHTIDPSLIGGMVARVGGTVYDSSLRTRLEQLRHTLVVAQA
ncbi:MAG: ATP synthase F1 subunit delta [Myxococcota bacterium]